MTPMRLFIVSGLLLILTIGWTSPATSLDSEPRDVAVLPDGSRVYLANYSAGTWVFDASTNDRVAVIPSTPPGALAASLAIIPDGTRAFISMDGDQAVNVVDTATSTIVERITVRGSPNKPVVSPDGTRVYLSVATGDERDGIIAIDTTTNQIVSTGAFGRRTIPTGVAVHPDGRRLYVATYESPDLLVMDTADLTVVASVPLGKDTGLDVAIDPSGSLVYVARQYGGEVTVVDAASNTVVAQIPGLPAQGSLALHPDGTRLYVSQPGAGMVSVVDTTSRRVIARVDGARPWGLAVHPDGSRLYVANAGNSTISVFDTATNALITTIPAQQSSPRPTFQPI
jgi:YVTN family beta-propeller protein